MGADVALDAHMILTGCRIQHEVELGRILIAPFNRAQLNPNSYNYRLAGQLYRVAYDVHGSNISYRLESQVLEKGRWLLKKGQLFLSTTLEVLGSDRFVLSLIGRSSIGRLGLFVQVSANIGHQGSRHRWTLELRPSIDIYLYPGQILGQVSFWAVRGRVSPYVGLYGRDNSPAMSKLHLSRDQSI